MAEEVEMTPVEMTPVDAAEPPKPAAPKLNPVAPPKPAVGGTTTGALKPGLKLPPKPAIGAGIKLPPKPGATVSALKPGLKLPTQNALKPGVKLPPKPGATVSALKPGLKLPQKPVIRKPGEGPAVSALPKPVLPKPITPQAPAAAPAAAEAPAPAAEKPVAVDAQGVGKLPTVESKAIARNDVSPTAAPGPSPLQQLKSVTQKLKGVTQEIPQQAILRKTGIIAEDAMSEAQKEAAKHKTARISLSDAMGVAPVKETAPLKTIRIKRPGNVPGSTATLKPQSGTAPAAAAEPSSGAPAAANDAADESSTSTQRKTLKIARPGGAVRPAGKFGIKRPGGPAAPAPAEGGADAPAAVADIPDVADIPEMPSAPQPNLPPAPAADDGPAWLWTLSALVQAAACVAIGALAWFLFQNSQTMYF